MPYFSFVYLYKILSKLMHSLRLNGTKPIISGYKPMPYIYKRRSIGPNCSSVQYYAFCKCTALEILATDLGITSKWSTFSWNLNDLRILEQKCFVRFKKIDKLSYLFFLLISRSNMRIFRGMSICTSRRSFHVFLFGLCFYVALFFLSTSIITVFENLPKHYTTMRPTTFIPTTK